ncbi:MAG: zinc-binding dehydrogenase [Bacteroidetes bacterium]|nr:zinc-binding dehydrogenase [Bacteroidota bacterium]
MLLQRSCYRMPKAGSIAHLTLVEEPLPHPSDQEVCVEVKAIGLNFADIFAMYGLYSATPEGSFVPGLEYAGVVHTVGKNVTTVKPGDRVMGVTRFGGYASHINTDYRYLIPVPGDWSFDEGAAYLVQVLTAYYGLKNLGALKAGQTVLIHSAAGGVGILANRIAKKMGAYTIGTVGSEYKLELLEMEGYDKGIVRTKSFKEDLIQALDGKELHLIMECIGGEILSQGFDVLAPMGRMVVYGSAQYGSPGDRPNYLRLLYLYLRRPKLDIQNLTNLNKSLMAFNLIHLYERVEIMHEILAEIENLSLSAPLVGHTFPYKDLCDAIKLFQKGKTIGKVVVKI